MRKRFRIHNTVQSLISEKFLPDSGSLRSNGFAVLHKLTARQAIEELLHDWMFKKEDTGYWYPGYRYLIFYVIPTALTYIKWSALTAQSVTVLKFNPLLVLNKSRY